jgi:predicted ArsR family transcriptional regulator
VSQGAKKSVSIATALYEKLADLVGTSGADSVDELASRIIRDWLSKVASPGTKKQTAVSEEDQKLVEERLKSLGYL